MNTSGRLGMYELILLEDTTGPYFLDGNFNGNRNSQFLRDIAEFRSVRKCVTCCDADPRITGEI